MDKDSPAFQAASAQIQHLPLTSFLSLRGGRRDNHESKQRVLFPFCPCTSFFPQSPAPESSGGEGGWGVACSGRQVFESHWAGGLL